MWAVSSKYVFCDLIFRPDCSWCVGLENRLENKQKVSRKGHRHLSSFLPSSKIETAEFVRFRGMQVQDEAGVTDEFETPAQKRRKLAHLGVYYRIEE